MFCHLTQQRQNPAWRPSRKNVRYGVCISDLPWLRLSENRSHDEVDRRSLYRSPLKFGPSSSSSSSRGKTDVQRQATKREKTKEELGPEVCVGGRGAAKSRFMRNNLAGGSERRRPRVGGRRGLPGAVGRPGPTLRSHLAVRQIFLPPPTGAARYEIARAR